jgi:hypothetical protein
MDSTHDSFSTGPTQLGEVKRRTSAKATPAKADAPPKPPAASAPPVDADRAASFDRKDTNHDGKLSLEEYVASQKEPDAARKRFQRWDANKDGLLSREEFLAGSGPSSR